MDIWDPWLEPYPLSQYRNGLVNHTYTADKLDGTLNLEILDGYDMLVICLPTANFTAQEVQDVTSWVAGGGGLFLMGDTPMLSSSDAYLNYLLSSFGIEFNLAGSTGFDIIASPADEHPMHETTSAMEYDDSSYLNLTGDAFPLWQTGPNVLCAGQEYQDGRVVVIGDVNLATTLAILEQHNYRFLMNVANWLSSATADVLLMNGEFLGIERYKVAPALALNGLGINYYLCHSPYYLNLSLYEYWEQWDLVIVDEPGLIIGAYLDDIQEWVESGGELIMSYYWMHNSPDHPLWPLLGVYPTAGAADEPDLYIWEPAHPIFNIPVEYDGSLFVPTIDYGTEGSLHHVFSNATALVGYTATSEVNQTAIALRNDLQTLFNGFLIDEFQGDHDESTYMDSFELWFNEIAFMYFERPTIDSPADATYVVGETGNEIMWTPSADAGPSEYILRINGSIDTTAEWGGEPIVVNIDNVNVSITTYQLTVIDVLGYTATDTVVLNVTAYVPPPGGLDPLLLIAIGAGAIIVVAIVLIASKRGKKE